MANELNIQLDPFSQTGLTLLGRIYSEAGTEQTGSPVSMSEVNTGLYSGNFTLTGIADGEYSVRFETNTPDKLYGTGALYVRNNAEVSQENFFNATLDTVANVTTVATTTTNTDMRGTDGANTIAPDNTGIAQIQTDISNLNDPTVQQIADGVWDEQYSEHTIAGSFGKLMDLLRKANLAVDGQVTANPTTTSFDTDLSDPTGTHNHQMMLFTTGALEGYSGLIIDFTNGVDNTITVQDPFPVAPSVNDEFVVLPYYSNTLTGISNAVDALITANHGAGSYQTADLTDVDTKSNVKPSIPI